MLALLLAGWVSARAMLWHNPFAPIEALAQTHQDEPLSNAAPIAIPHALSPLIASEPPESSQTWPEALAMDAPTLPIFRATVSLVPPQSGASATLEAPPAALAPPVARRDAPFVAPMAASAAVRPERWSLDAWAFWRQGSGAAPISQGRVPIYGASQVGAVLQYRIAPASARDPRLYARAYRAMVRRGEEELALGASIRPLARVPVRIAGELRLTDAAFRNEARPSAYAVTELPPIAVSRSVRIEAYGQAGWVGGTDATAFADGQASLMRDIGMVAARSHDRLHLAVGAAAWGGAQEGTHRIDIGPTLRLDLTVAETPLRLSIDWREQIAGQAAPASGLAATVSARF